MARKKRRVKKIVRTTRPKVYRATPLTKIKKPKPVRRITKQVGQTALSRREPAKRLTENVPSIRKKRVLPVLSKIQINTCRNKKAKARHDYFSMRAAGAGGFRLPGPHKNRFTVRCK